MRRRILLFLLAVALLPACKNNATNNSEALKALHEYLANSPEQLAELRTEISKETADSAMHTIHAYLAEKTKAKFQSQWDSMALQLNDKVLRFKYKKFGDKPAKGWSLFISMHGGGGAAPELNDQQWENQINLYTPKEGIYLAPRAPTNTWNMWHQAHIDSLFSQLIELVDVYEGINTNRVYLTGYSAGGDGTYQLAPRMADQLAAAAMMAGHPNDASPLGLRNLPFALHMGAEDGAYHRNEIAANWKIMLDSLQQQDPDGYIHDVQLHEGMGHWMQHKDTVAIDWMTQFSRNPYPQKVVWKQSGVTHNRFYWLAVPANEAMKKAEVIASISGQTITIEKATLIPSLIVLLNDEMLDLNKKVKVIYQGKEIYHAVPTRNIATIWQSLSERNDTNQVFSAKITINLEQTIKHD